MARIHERRRALRSSSAVVTRCINWASTRHSFCPGRQHPEVAQRTRARRDFVLRLSGQSAVMLCRTTANSDKTGTNSPRATNVAAMPIVRSDDHYERRC